MTYDLVIRGGTVVDGSGLPRYRADVGIRGDRIARIGTHPRSRPRGGRRAPSGRRARLHRRPHPHGRAGGVGSARHVLVLARRDQRRHGQLRLHAGALPRRRDGTWSCATSSGPRTSPPRRCAAGIEWTWETYAQYLDAVDRLPKGINYAGYVGHSALRTYAMGERAFSEPATADDLAVMKRELADALAAGAMGFTTSRTRNHETADDGRWPAASPSGARCARWCR